MKKFIIIVFTLFILFFSLNSQTISSLGVSGSYYDIRSDNNGTIHIIWIENGWQKYGQIVNRQIVNQVTIPVLNRSEVITKKFRPRLAVKPDGSEVHFVWATPLSKSKDLMHCWRDSGGTWRKEKIYTSSKYMLAPAFAVDSSGVWHAAVVGDNGANVIHPIVYFRKAVGASWERMTNIAPATREFLWPNLFTDTNGNVHITWDKDKDFIQYRYAPSGGDLSTSTTITLPNLHPHNKESEVFADSLGNVHVAALSFQNGGTPGGIDYWVKPAGGSFSTAITVSGAAFPIISYFPYPAIIARSTDMVAVSWARTNSTSNPATIEVATYDGSWTIYTISTTANVKADTRTTMAMDNSTAYLVWREGDQVLYLATFDYAMFGVISPNGGEKWGVEKTYDIKWNLENSTGNVDINLFKNNVNLGPIVSDIADSGSYAWTINNLESGTEILTGDDYQVEVTARNGSDDDMSNEDFSISASIDITAPLAGVIWNMGTTQEITWEKTGTQNDYVNITLFKSGSAVLNIGTSVDNSGSFFWNIPGTISPDTTYIIRVETTDGSVVDDSDFFSILGSIEVTSPSAGEEWLYGETHTITWVATGTMNSSVKLRLQQNGSNIVAITDVTPNDGSYSWTVPASVPAATNYVVMVKTIDSVVFDTSEEFTIAEESNNPTLTVTSPVSSSNWSSGSTHSVTWNKTGAQDANVKIELFKNGALDTTIISSTANDGSYSWMIDGNKPTGSDYMVRITTLDGQITDDSDTFTITLTSPEITVTSPASGVDWRRGSSYTISWDTAGSMDANVKIELIKGGALNTTIISSTANDGSYSWTIDPGQTTGTDYVVRVTTVDNAVTDDSGQFTISDQPVDGITVTSPNSSSQWFHGNTYTITWDRTGTMGSSVKLRLQQNGANIVTITNSTPNDGSYSWTVPVSVPSASNYVIMVKTTDNLVFDISDEFYVGTTIVTPTLTVTSPVSSSNWSSGSTHSVTWNKTGAQDANVKIELFKNGALDTTIISSTANDGSYSWMIDGNKPTGSDYMVRITTLDGQITDDSDTFTITLTSPEITVTSPASGVDWRRGSSYTISWDTAGSMDANVKIELIKGGALNTTIISSTANDGSYSWTIDPGQTTGTDYVVRVTTVDNAVTDDSGQFTISDQPVDGITVTSPNSSSQWFHGNTYTITWDRTGTMGSSVKLRLQQNGANIVTITNSTPNDGSYSWTVPVSVPSASNYVIMVKTTDNLVFDISDEFYVGSEVVTPTITVTSPISSSYWITGSTYAITWDKTGTQNANVKIELYKGGTLDSPIIATTPNSGSYSWTINGAQTPGSDYVVKVTTVDDQITDDSDQFEISDTPVSATIDITSPSGTSELNAGSSTTITWNKTGTQNANVNIYLYLDGVFQSNVVLGTPNDGSYSWTLGSGLSSSSRYMVRVETADSQVRDDSNVFSIFGAGITINIPEADDTIVKGSTVDIKWKKVGSQNGNVKIRLQQNGANIVVITDSTANDGLYSWTVPVTLTNSDDYYFMVKTLDNLVYDTSDLIKVAPAGITVESPSTNNVLKRGSQYTITWTKNGTQNANVKLRVFQGDTQVFAITDSTPNNGSYTWTVPSDFTMADDLTIRVKTIDNAVADDSGKFTIED